MAGTKDGGKKAAATNKSRYGKDYYREMGRRGGKNGHTGGFAANPALAKIAGAKGGKISKRGKAKPKVPHIDEDEFEELKYSERVRLMKEIRELEEVR